MHWRAGVGNVANHHAMRIGGRGAVYCARFLTVSGSKLAGRT